MTTNLKTEPKADFGRILLDRCQLEWILAEPSVQLASGQRTKIAIAR